jgi:formylglycine-generating enzyme required for sulfatase activity
VPSKDRDDSANLLTSRQVARPGKLPYEDMVWIPDDTFTVGSDKHYAEEAPVHRVMVKGFWINKFAVTNQQFAQFLEETGHVTSAERPPNPDDYPGAKPEMLQLASVVFLKPAAGADWRHPEGPESDGYERTAPVAQYPPNGYGLFDMIGNVWEWTTDGYSCHHPAIEACCAGAIHKGGERDQSYDPQTPNLRIPRKVIKGGSFLCAPNYCRRYRPAARMAQPIDTSACHVGLRLIVRVKPEVQEHAPHVPKGAKGLIDQLDSGGKQ